MKQQMMETNRVLISPERGLRGLAWEAGSLSSGAVAGRAVCIPGRAPEPGVWAFVGQVRGRAAGAVDSQPLLER